MASHSYNVPFMFNPVIRDFLDHAPPFTIFPRSANGVPGPQYYPPHVTAAINLCRAMMHHYKGRQSFKIIAVRFSMGRPMAWYLQGSRRMTMDEVSHEFVDLILVVFPRVFIDYDLTNLDDKGEHIRREWHESFNPAHQAISLNGEMIDRMSASFRYPASERELDFFRAHLFKVANVLFHEMGHVFLTYLTEGRALTPANINDPTVGISTTGEAGRALEYTMFGGTLNWLRVSGTPNDGCGTAYLKKPSGGFYRIRQKSINDTVSYYFDFPYETSESAENRPLRRLGEGHGPDNRTDPLERAEVAYLLH